MTDQAPSGLPVLGAQDGYRSLREAAAIVPVERDVVSLRGPDAVQYLQGQCSQDVAALVPGGSADALLLEPQGRIDALIRVTRTGEDELIVDTDSGWGETVVARLERFKLRVKVDVSLVAWHCIAVRGPLAAGIASAPGFLRLAVDWPGLRGFDLLGDDPHLLEGVERCGTEAWEPARIEAGIPVMGSEIDSRTIPEEAGLVERCVSFTKGCFTGQELVARLDARGSNVARRLRGLVFSGDEAMSEVGAGTELMTETKNVGRITSAAWSPGIGATVALAYVHRSIAVGSTVTAGGVSAQVRQLPLVGSA